MKSTQSPFGNPGQISLAPESPTHTKQEVAPAWLIQSAPLPTVSFPSEKYLEILNVLAMWGPSTYRMLKGITSMSPSGLANHFGHLASNRYVQCRHYCQDAAKVWEITTKGANAAGFAGLSLPGSADDLERAAKITDFMTERVRRNGSSVTALSAWQVLNDWPLPHPLHGRATRRAYPDGFASKFVVRIWPSDLGYPVVGQSLAPAIVMIKRDARGVETVTAFDVIWEPLTEAAYRAISRAYDRSVSFDKVVLIGADDRVCRGVHDGINAEQAGDKIRAATMPPSNALKW